jgi:molecular chaperone HscB
MTDLSRLLNAPDHFALFDLSRAFSIDPESLQSKYLELTRATHPDFAGADAEAQIAAMDLSARVNDAYKVLSDPEERANYLLGLLGGPAKEEDKSLPKGFLEQMLMVREEMEEAQASNDATTLKAMEQDARGRRENHLLRVTQLFDQLTSQSDSSTTRRAIRLELNALRYIERMLEQIYPSKDIL